MSTPTTVASENSRARVSVFARLVPALSFTLAAAGAAASSLYIRNVMWAMRDAGSAGISAVAGGIGEANLFVLVALYLAAVCGLAGVLVFVIRLLMVTKTVSPSSWFFFAGGALGLSPAVMLWVAETILIGALARRTNVVEVVSTINLLTSLSMIVAPISILLLLAGSVWPLSTQSKRRWAPLVAPVVVELLLIAIAVAFQIRTSWLYQVRLLERL